MELKFFAVFCVVFAIYQANGICAGGVQVNPDQIPYQVSLLTVIKHPCADHFQPFCGASLISNRWILTSAFCANRFNLSKVHVVVGAYYLQKDGDTYSIETAINHPEYSEELHLNDISLVKTKEQVVFNNVVRPIRMSEKIAINGDRALLSGWGCSANKWPYVLLGHQYVQVISNEDCAAAHLPQYAKFIYESTICTTSQILGEYHGDPGGPLAVDNRLVGVVSWRTGEPDYPDQYMRISSYLNWIEQHTGIVGI